MTCPDMYASFPTTLAIRAASAVSAMAEQRKQAKYAELEASHHLVTVALETTVVCGPVALKFLHEPGHRGKL